MSDTNQDRLVNTFLDASDLYVAKWTLLVKCKDMRWLSIFWLEADDIYSLDASISNKLGFYLTIFDGMSSRSWEF